MNEIEINLAIPQVGSSGHGRRNRTMMSLLRSVYGTTANGLPFTSIVKGSSSLHREDISRKSFLIPESKKLVAAKFWRVFTVFQQILLRHL